MPDDLFDALRGEPAVFAPRTTPTELRTRARTRTRARVAASGVLAVAALGVAAGVASAGPTGGAGSSDRLVPGVAGPAPVAPGTVAPAPEPSTAAPTSPGTASPGAGSPAPSRAATPTRPATPRTTTAAPAPPRSAAPSAPSPSAPSATPSATDVLAAGRYGVKVLSVNWDERGKHLVVDLGRLSDGEPTEPGVDGTRPVLFDTRGTVEKQRVDLAPAHDMVFSHRSGEYGPDDWAGLVTEVDSRGTPLLATIVVDAQGRLTALEEPYRP